MTDDERMDRARRIREMREGTRPDAQGDDSDAADHNGDDSVDDGDETATDRNPAAEPADDVAESADDADPADESEPAGDDDGVTGAVSDGPEAGGDGDDAGDGGGDGGGLRIPGADIEDVEVDVAELAEQAGLDTAEAAAATGGADGNKGAETGDGVAAPVGMAGAEAAGRQVDAAAETRVLEFDLGSERFCLDIEHVEEIVKRETVTRVPNTPDYVEGVVDLRGQITTILDPKALLGIDAEGSKELIVVFDPDEFEDQGAIGWVVDDVNQVTPVRDDELGDSPGDEDHVNGVVERDGEFVIWTEPGVAIENAAG